MKHPSGDADTMPASDPGADPARDRRPTIPDLPSPLDSRYQLGVELGRGGMGRVVEAFDVQLGRSVALKEVLPKGGPTVERRFVREVQITARLEHPSIVPLYDSGRMPDGRPFYVMRRVTGQPLDQLVARARDLPERLALLPNVLAATDAVGHAHRRGIVHRDLKPGNILVGENGETVVIDWGLAKVVGEDDDPPEDDRSPTPADTLQTQAGSVFGTPGFMPPEQARGEGSSPCGDVFALGATLYQLLAGRPPIGGASATDVIASTILRRITPVADAAPGAPPELHAIVEKALALDPRDRYPDAERLAEDLRRFLTGQLVAAHRYTTRERVTRFARKHRAPLSVAALALAAVAVLAWIGVHRILVERDLARDASLEADRERTAVQHLNATLLDRADALRITQARALVGTNPTAALAVLAELRADSPRGADAHGLAASAVARGVAWGLRADGTPRFLDLDRDARRLAEVTTDGTLHVWDLETHRVLYERVYDADARPLWLGDGRLLLIGYRGKSPAFLDLASGRTEPFPIGPIELGTLDSAGARLAFLDEQHRASTVDIASGKVSTYWAGHTPNELEIGSDGSWLALADHSQTVVIDVASGAVLLTLAGRLLVFAVTADRAAGIDGPTGVPFELVRDVHGAWAERTLALPAGPRAYAMSYRGERVDIITTDGVFTFADGKRLGRRQILGGNAIAQLAHDTTVLQTSAGTLAYFNEDVSGTLQLPAPLADVHVAGRRDQTRVVVAGTGLVLVYELAQVLPSFVPKLGVFDGMFVDRDTLLLWPNSDLEFTWRDVSTGRSTALSSGVLPLAEPFDRDANDGRVLLYQTTGPKTAELVVARKGQRAAGLVVSGNPSLCAVLAPDGVLYAQRSDARVMLTERGAPPRELAKVAGGVVAVRVLDRRHFAALGHEGELVRGELAGGAIERVHVEPSNDALIAPDRDGNVVIGSRKRLQVWRTGGGIRDLAVMPHPITHVEASGAGLLVDLDDNSAYYVEPNGTEHEIFAPSSRGAANGSAGSWVASVGTDGEVNIVELPSLARWSLPSLFSSPTGQVEIAPTGRRLMVSAFGGYELFDLPDPGTDLAPWIEDHTNAFESPDGALAWPWQRTP